MKLLGKVLHTGTKGPILKASITPKVGQPVFNSKGERVGNIYDLFGPVGSPYTIIKPASGISPKQLVGSALYIGEKREEVEKWRKKRNVPSAVGRYS